VSYLKIESKYEKEINEYKNNNNRILWKNQAKQTSDILQLLVEAITKANDFSMKNFHALIYITAHKSSISATTKIDKIRQLKINKDYSEKILNLIHDDIGCWALPRKNYEEYIHDRISEVWDLIKAIYEKDEEITLVTEIDDFAQRRISNLQSGLLSPIFYCLKPTMFPIINGKSIKIIKGILGTNISNKILDYNFERKKFLEFREAYDFSKDFRDLDGFVLWCEKKKLF